MCFIRKVIILFESVVIGGVGGGDGGSHRDKGLWSLEFLRNRRNTTALGGVVWGHDSTSTGVRTV